nr:hypothetical protein B0A51_12481 [Rachicladosporium sp. CCFEE 5018]
MAGYGNKTSSGFGGDSDSNTRFGTSDNTDSYSGGTGVGSGTTSGAGYGNKTGDSSNIDSSDTRFGTGSNTGAYSGADSSSYGSGATGGAGFGNKSSDHDSKDKKSDSTMGKLMEKAGGMLKNEKIADQGREKREQAGYGQGSSDNY